eukprot:COSAG02_NODE_627_length_19327_cov_4.448382_6_plen_1194_part_01
MRSGAAGRGGVARRGVSSPFVIDVVGATAGPIQFCVGSRRPAPNFSEAPMNGESASAEAAYLDIDVVQVQTPQQTSREDHRPLARNSAWAALRETERGSASALGLDDTTWKAALRAHRAHSHGDKHAWTSMIHVGGLDTYIHEAQKTEYEQELGSRFAQFGTVDAVHLFIRQEVDGDRLKYSWAVVGFHSPLDARAAVENVPKLRKPCLRVTMFDRQRMPAEAADGVQMIAKTLANARQNRVVQDAVRQYLATQSVASPQSPKRRAQQNKTVVQGELQIKSDLEQTRRAATAVDVETKIQALAVTEEAQIDQAGAAIAQESAPQTSKACLSRVEAQKQTEVQAKKEAALKSAALKQARESVSQQVGEIGSATDATNPAEIPLQLRQTLSDLLAVENDSAMAEAMAAAVKRVRMAMEAQIDMSGKDIVERQLAAKVARAKEREVERRRRNKTRSAGYKAWEQLGKQALNATIRLQMEQGEEQWSAKQAELKEKLAHELADLEESQDANQETRKKLQSQHSERLQKAKDAHRTMIQDQFEQASRSRRATALGIDVDALLKMERDLSARRLIDLHRKEQQEHEAIDKVRADIFGNDMVMMLVESLSDLEEQVGNIVAALQNSYENLQRLRNSLMVCTGCCRRSIVGIPTLTDLLKDTQHLDRSTDTDTAESPSQWVHQSHHTRVAALHGAVYNMKAELQTYPLLATFTPESLANELVDLYDRALLVARPRQRLVKLPNAAQGSAGEKMVGSVPRRSRSNRRAKWGTSAHDDLSPHLSEWEQLDLLAQLSAQQLGFSAEIWNAVPSYVVPRLSSSSVFSKNEEEVRADLRVMFARFKDDIERGKTALKDINTNIAQLRREMSLMCMECMQAEVPQPLSNIKSIVRSRVVDGEKEYWVQFVGKEETTEKVSWRVIQEETDAKSLASTDLQLKAFQPVLRSLEQELTMTRRLMKRERAPPSDYLRRLQVGIDAQVVATNHQTQHLKPEQAVTLVLTADCKSVWLLSRATEVRDGPLHLKIDVRTITRLVYGPALLLPQQELECNHLRDRCDLQGRESWRQLSFTYQAGQGNNGRSVALKTDDDTDGLTATLGLLVLRGYDIRAGTRAKLLWRSARMRTHSRSHQQPAETSVNVAEFTDASMHGARGQSFDVSAQLQSAQATESVDEMVHVKGEGGPTESCNVEEADEQKHTESQTVSACL